MTESGYNTTDNPIYVVSDVNAQGYGTIGQAVMRKREISSDAKALYAYFSSFAGTGCVAFPAWETILYELNWSPQRFRKYRDELIAWGLLVVDKKSIGFPAKVRTIYTLPSNPLGLEDDIKAIVERRLTAQANMSRIADEELNPTKETTSKPQVDSTNDKFSAGRKNVKETTNVENLNAETKPQVSAELYNLYSDVENSNECTICTVNSVQIEHQNRHHNKEKKNNNKINTQSVSSTGDDFLVVTEPNSAASSEQSDGRTDGSIFKELLDVSLKTVPPQAEESVRAAFAKKIAEGYTAQAILMAYRRYVVRYRSENPDTTRYAMRLEDWLNKGNGLAWYAQRDARDCYSSGTTTDQNTSSSSATSNEVEIIRGQSLYALRAKCASNEDYCKLFNEWTDLCAQLAYNSNNELPKYQIELKLSSIADELRDIAVHHLLKKQE